MAKSEPAEDVLWREPTQERSRRRVDAILAAARQLIREEGSERLRMRQVAERAGVPIGSLYQFFPDRTALLACLFAKHLGVVRVMLRERLAAATSAADLEIEAEHLVESIYEALLADPALVDIWTGIQANKAIRYLDLADSQRNARFLFDIVRPWVRSDIEDARLQRACFLICDLAGSACRTALELPRSEGDDLVREYARMARAYVRSFLVGE